MKTNYHAHTHRCGHAEPGERRYVETALKEGFQVFGFADHVPMPYPDFRSSMRMGTEETADYVKDLVALQEEFRGKVEVHIGFEAEYLPEFFEKMLCLLEPHPYEYLILGQHFLDREQGSVYTGMPTDQVATLTHYVEECTRGLNTGAFSCFAHPDLIHFCGEETIYREEMRRLCREAQACGVPLEFNLLGFGTNRHYPHPAFWEEAAVVGNDVLLGWDAHSPSWLEQSELAAQAHTFLASLGLTCRETMPLVRPHPSL